MPVWPTVHFVIQASQIRSSCPGIPMQLQYGPLEKRPRPPFGQRPWQVGLQPCTLARTDCGQQREDERRTVD